MPLVLPSQSSQRVLPGMNAAFNDWLDGQAVYNGGLLDKRPPYVWASPWLCEDGQVWVRMYPGNYRDYRRLAPEHPRVHSYQKHLAWGDKGELWHFQAWLSDTHEAITEVLNEVADVLEGVCIAPLS